MAKSKEQDDFTKLTQVAVAGVSGGLQGLFRAASMLPGPLGVAASGIGALTAAAQHLTQLANPSTMIRFNQALENFGAAIGQMFVPLFEKLIPIIDRFNSAVTTLIGPVQRLVTAFMDAVTPAINSLADLLAQQASLWATLQDAISPLQGWLLNALVSSFKNVVDVIAMVVIALDELVKSFQRVFAGEAFGDLFGNVAKRIREMNQPGGKTLAAGQARFAGLEDVGRMIAVSAANSSAKSAQERGTSYLGEIDITTKAIRTFLETAQRISNKVEGAAGGLLGVISPAAGTAKAVHDFFANR